MRNSHKWSKKKKDFCLENLVWANNFIPPELRITIKESLSERIFLSPSMI